jgi:hypothetical protein
MRTQGFFRGVVQVAMSDAQNKMKINHEETKSAKTFLVLPSFSSLLRG